MKKLICLIALPLLAASPALAKSKLSGRIASLADLSVAATPTFDISEVSRLSIQVNYASSTVANVSFIEGRKSAATITVNNNTFIRTSTPTIIINGSSVTYAPGAVSSDTAKAIADAINANAALSPIVTSSYTPTGIVFSTSTGLGLNAYSITSSSWAALTPNVSIFANGADGAITSGTDLITAANTYGLGQGAWVSVLAGSAPSGLTAGTTYFVIPVLQGRTFKLATTAANAVLGTAIDISTTTTGGGSYTLVNSTTTTGASFVLQGSNDGNYWSTLPSTGTVLVGVPSGVTSLIYDGQFLNVRYFRLNYAKPIAGGMDIDIWVQGKNDE